MAFERSVPKAHQKLLDLRNQLKIRQIEGYLVPKTDAHQGEYIPEASERLRWLTGFTGSSGLVFLSQTAAGIFVDGRYTAQVRTQVDLDLFQPQHFERGALTQWAEKNFNPGDQIGYDPWVISESFLEKLQTLFAFIPLSLVPVRPHLIDALWSPGAPLSKAPIVVHPLEYAGQTINEKLRTLYTTLQHQKVDGVVLNSLESIHWLLNFRGNDVPTAPLSLCFSILLRHLDRLTVHLFIDLDKITNDVTDHLKHEVAFYPYEKIESFLISLAHQEKKILLDPQTAPALFFQILENPAPSSRGQSSSCKLKESSVLRGTDPCLFPKSIKNSTEVRGAIEAHIRDGVAVCSFLAWLAQEVHRSSVTEVHAAEYLLSCRQRQHLFQKPSFDTISSTGPHGAIVHYNPYMGMNRVIHPTDIYLVDSGGHYLDGTTDVTRVVVFEPASPHQKDQFTRVLKGHIALATICFPEGTTGSQLDVLARQYLWQAGLDYAHSTGHGVGSYLSVHEGPQSISARPNTIALCPGMICSNEPGYYQEGDYGFRIESLVLVKTANSLSIPERAFYKFQTLTLVPIDRHLMDQAQLTSEEILWINSYHKEIWDTLSSLVDPHTQTWLHDATQPL